MVRRFAATLAALWLIPSLIPGLIPGVSLAQLTQPSGSPVPLYPGAVPRSFEAEPLPPLPPGQETPRPPDAAPPAGLAPPPAVLPPAAPAAAAPAMPGPAGGREFCDQQVTAQLAPPDTVPEHFRPFLGLWSDASWTPQLCAALIVERVAPDGTATIVYVFGPMGANPRASRGILHGTGIIRDGELRFQNSDGSQFAFRPVYADLGGRLTTPQGQSYEAIFKKTP